MEPEPELINKNSLRSNSPTDLKRRLEKQQKEDLKEYQLIRERSARPAFHKQQNIGLKAKAIDGDSLASDSSGYPVVPATKGSKAPPKSKFSAFSRQNKSQKRMMMYRMPAGSSNNLRMSI